MSDLVVVPQATLGSHTLHLLLLRLLVIGGLALLLVAILACGQQPRVRRFASLPSLVAQAEAADATTLSVTDGHFLWNGQPAFLLTGEFPYYRIAASDWAARLDQVQAAGVRIVTFYIPWNWHMPNPDAADFDGHTHPSRNLIRLLQLIQERHMYAIAKPGPFICAEVQHGGIPDWFTAAHPEALTRNAQGKLVGFRQDGKPLPAYLAPAYISAVRDWYDRVSRVLRDWQAPAGPLVAVQVENEIPYSTSELADPFSWGYSAAEIDLYRSWLQDQYPGPDGLVAYNRAHQTTYAAWDEVYPPGMRPLPLADTPVQLDEPGASASTPAAGNASAASAPAAEPARLRRWLTYRDWVRFRAYYGAQVLRVYGEMLRRTGITVPFYHNALMLEDEAPASYGPMSQTMWLGVNYWLPKDPRTDEDAFVQGIYRVMLLQALAPASPRYAPELNWGWGNEGSFDFLSRYLLPFLNGFNVYTIVNGDLNPTVAGHPYSNNAVPYPGSAPIGADGQTGTAYRALQQLAWFLNATGSDLVQTSAPATVAIGYYGPYNEERLYYRWAGLPASAVADLVGRDANALPEQQPLTADAWQSTQTLMAALLHAGVEFRLVDLNASSPTILADELASYKAVVFWSWDYLSHTVQLALAQYVRDGGQLVLSGQVPMLDENFRPDSTLAQALSGISPHGNAATPVLHGNQPTPAVVAPRQATDLRFWSELAAANGWNSPIRITLNADHGPDPAKGDPATLAEVFAFRRIGTGGCFLILVNRNPRPANVTVTFSDERANTWKLSTTVGGGRVQLVHLKDGQLVAASPALDQSGAELTGGQ